MYRGGTQVVSFKVDKNIIQIIDLFVEVGLYTTRSEFIRDALRTLIRIVLEKHSNLLESYLGHRPIKKALTQVLSE